jgi:hypothetical protein
MSGQLPGDLFGLAAIQRLQRGTHVLVEVRSLHLVQPVIEVPLVEIVHELIQREPLLTYPADVSGTHQPVLPVRLAAQSPDQQPFITLEHLGQHLGGKVATFHAGRRQCLLQLLIQPVDPLLNDTFDPRRQCSPFEVRSFYPSSAIVLDEVPPHLQGAQQLHGKQRMPTGKLKEGPAKILAQSIRLRVQEGIHKPLSFRLLRLGQVHRDVPIVAANLVDHPFEGMALARSSQGHLFRPVRADDEDPVGLDPPHQVKQQADRRGVRPVQIVQYQHQGMLGGQLLQHSGVLLKDAGLVRD